MQMNDHPTPPRRIQLRRCRGWRKPANTVVVARPGPWGNPFKADAPNEGRTRAWAVTEFRKWVQAHPEWLKTAAASLHGHNLACWCPPSEPCHADVLLELINNSMKTEPAPEIPVPAIISREQWLERCAARFIAVAGLTPDLARDCAASQLEALKDDLSENPEQAADDEMECWTPD